MKNVLKTALLSLVFATVFSVCTYASDVELSQVKFFDADSSSANVVKTYPTVGNSIYVKTSAKNISDSGKKLILLAGCYGEDGSLKRIFSKDVDLASESSEDLTLKIDVEEENLEIIANAFIFNSAANTNGKNALYPCMKNATLLCDSTDLSFIEINGKRLSDYANDKDEYFVTVSESEATAVIAPKDATTGIDISVPHLPGYFRINVTSQFGTKRSILVMCDTENPVPRPIENANLILKLDSENNSGENILNKDYEKWTDISGYNNSLTALNTADIWTDNGLKSTVATSGVLAPFPQVITDAFNSYNFSIQFTIASADQVVNSKCPILSSPNGNLILYVKQNTSEVYFKFGNAIAESQMPCITKADLLSGVNTIVVNSSEIKWYVDGVLKATKDVRSTTKTADSVNFSCYKSGYAGSTTIKTFKVYNKALSASEVR